VRCMPLAETVYIQLGSNIGNREHYLHLALDRLSSLEGLEVIAVSGVYLSEARDMPGDNPPFLNQVVKAEYQYKAVELLRSLEAIERDLGRTGKGKKTPRTIDLDILLFGDRVFTTDGLSVPHPELLRRPFVILPLLEIDPHLNHPVSKRPIAGSLTDRDRDEVILYRNHVTRSIGT
jgi:2-amino-4-hydroxy-6-hydroxymethyldihydropteridine diphosphokinase